MQGGPKRRANGPVSETLGWIKEEAAGVDVPFAGARDCHA